MIWEAVMVVLNTRVRNGNVREISRKTKMNYGFTEPASFVGGVCLLWDSLEVFLVPDRFEAMHLTFIENVIMASPYL